jgi:hypothetical protein
MNQKKAYYTAWEEIAKRRAIRLAPSLQMIREVAEAGRFEIRLRLTRPECDDLSAYGYDVKFPWFKRGTIRPCLVSWKRRPYTVGPVPIDSFKGISREHKKETVE